jgi:peptide/nickel transport system substrate-binding protein
MSKTSREHPYISDFKRAFVAGGISRREFIRYAALLGASMGSISTFLVGCGSEPAEEATEPSATSAPSATSGPKRGGVLRCACPVDRIDHPSRTARTHTANQWRHVLEYLTLTDRKSITHPYLLEKWEVSDDLKTWTLHLRKNVTWNNGDEFVADDVVFTMKEWLNPEVGSSMSGLMSYLTADGITKKDEHTVVLNLESPQIAVPEHLFAYPAMIINHRVFEGDITKAPVGTGPYTMEEYSVDERAVLKARDDYWQMGADGKPLPYLDEITYIDVGEEQTAAVAAFKSGGVDTFYDVSPASWQAVRDDPETGVDAVTTARTVVLRIRADQEPWSDNRLRKALKICQNREKILNLAYFGEGLPGQDTHVAPAHPEYCEIETPAYDPEQAKELLAEAGYPDGMDVELNFPTGRDYVKSYAEALKEDAAAAGFRITLNPMPDSQYYEVWTEIDVGLTPWGHRALAVMVLPLAYSCNEDGEPAAWNETRWCDKEFLDLLNKAQGTLDLEKRREIMCQLEQIQQERGSIGNAFWMNLWAVYRKGFHGIYMHPSQFDLWNEVWYDPDTA